MERNGVLVLADIYNVVTYIICYPFLLEWHSVVANKYCVVTYCTYNTVCNVSLVEWRSVLDMMHTLCTLPSEDHHT